MLLRKTSRGTFYIYSILLLLISFNALPVSLIDEYQNTNWSPQQTVPGYDLETFPPILIADQNRTVHAFSSQWINQENNEALRAIVYNRWTLANGWTTPTDIILSPNKEARITDARLDSNGKFHVLFFGGDNTDANIYYTQAPAAIVDNARAWSDPIVIGENAGDPAVAVFAENDQGTLYVIYNGRQLGNGLYTVSSVDDGKTWSEPLPIFFTIRDEPNINNLKVIRGKSGWLHAIWGVFNVSSQGRGIYYSRSQDGNEWSEPLLLADAQEGLGTWTPTIIEYDDTIVVLYNLLIKIHMRRSIDNGETWESPSIIFPRHVGMNGSLALVIDSNYDLHLFFGQRISGNPDIHGMWHSRYINERWLEPEAVIKGPMIIDLVGNKSFAPYETRAVVSQGNTFLVAWRTDFQAKGNGVWFAYKTLDAPELPVTPWLVTELKNTAHGTPIMSLEDSSTPTIKITQPTTFDLDSVSASSTSNPSLPILIGIIPIVMLLILIIIRKNIEKN